MSTLVIPVSKILTDKLEQIINEIDCDRVILVHSSKTGSAIDTNLRQLESFLSSKNNKLDISIQPLNCSDYPFALGESFSNWIISDFKENNTEYFVIKRRINELDIIKAVIDATLVFLFVRLIVGILGMDFYNIHWWFTVGVFWTCSNMVQRAGLATNDLIEKSNYKM